VEAKSLPDDIALIMKWNDLGLELLNEHGNWVKIVEAKPEEFLIAWRTKHGIFVWCHTDTTEIRITGNSCSPSLK
jgi:hypothetical protein